MGLFDFVGDIFGLASQNKMNKDNIALQQQTNAQQMMMFGEQRADTQRFHAENLAAQQEAAKNAIQWRVADARAAGLHPLYAMGNPGISVGPSGAFAAAPPQLQAPSTSGNVEAMTGLGQNIGRAAHAQMTKGERQKLLQNQMAEAALERDWNLAERRVNLERGILQNDVLRSEIALNKQRTAPAPPVASTPEFRMGGSAGSSARVQPVPAQPVINAEGVPSREAGNDTDWGYRRTAGGGLSLRPSSDAKRNMEDDIPQTLNWYWRNSILPLFDAETRRQQRPRTSEFPLPSGYEWRYDSIIGEYRPRRISGARRQRRPRFRGPNLGRM